MHLLAFLHLKFEDAARHLTRHTVFRHLGLALQVFRFLVESENADDANHRNYTCQHAQGEVGVHSLFFYRGHNQGFKI